MASNKNGVLNPNDFLPHSTKKVWWKCKDCSFEWESKICYRSNNQSPCFKCKSLEYVNPQLCLEWNYKKNGNLTPKDVTCSSGKKVWWKCSICGNEWMAYISNRNMGMGCPNHGNGFLLKDGTYFQSMVEAFYYLKYKKLGIQFFHNKKYGGMGEKRYDFYLPRENKYIEITSYGKNNWPSWFKKSWSVYFDKIMNKKKYVEDVLGAKFEFIQTNLTSDEKQLVHRNMKVMG